jgi:hypothetical protein
MHIADKILQTLPISPRYKGAEIIFRIRLPNFATVCTSKINYNTLQYNILDVELINKRAKKCYFLNHYKRVFA